MSHSLPPSDEAAEERLVAFEAAWKQGGCPQIEAFLSGLTGGSRAGLLVELVMIDLDHRWAKSDRVPVSSYLARFPELAAGGHVPAALVEAERRLRRRHGASGNGEEHPAAKAPPPPGPAVDPNAPTLIQTTNVSAEGTTAPPLFSNQNPPETTPDHKRFDDYDLLKELGHGGMGVVWRARQHGTNREVALKLIGANFMQSASSRGRFRREIELAASLDHPYIARVFAGQVDREPYYYSMELIEGENLRDHVQNQRSTFFDIAHLVLKLSGAIQHAHERGVVHRDLKPSNILVDKAGQPHILDFGLAVSDVLDQHRSLGSTDGSLVGTIPYMAPEQAAGMHGSHITPRTDIFSLGIVLYELLTGERPFRGTVPAVIHAILNDDPLPPSKLKTSIPPALEAIALKALKKEPSQRFSSAADMGMALRRFLEGDTEAMEAKSSRFVTWCRNPRRIREAGFLSLAGGAVFTALHLIVIILLGIFAIFDPSRLSDMNVTAMVVVMSLFILTLDIPYLILSQQLIKQRLWALFIALAIDIPLALASWTIFIFPELYPVQGIHQNDEQRRAIWFFVAVFASASLVAHAIGAIAYRSNRELLAWQRKMVESTHDTDGSHLSSTSLTSRRSH